MTAQAEPGELPIAVGESHSNLVVLMLTATFPRDGPRPPVTLRVPGYTALVSVLFDLVTERLNGIPPVWFLWGLVLREVLYFSTPNPALH